MTHKTLIIKTGYSEILEEGNNSKVVSFGDVLRITPLLHVYKDTDVTWVTDLEAFPLLLNNPFIKRILPYDLTTVLQLKSEEFDTVINLEKIPGICALADEIKARKIRHGFTFDTQTGEAKDLDKAYEVLAVGCDKIAKKNNNKTSQELLFEMVGAKWNGEKYLLGYKPKKDEEYDIALNTYVGQKWPTKAWNKKNWDYLEEILIKNSFKVTRQDKQNDLILKNLYCYIDWINSANILVSSDSLGLHLGIALEKKVFGLFGPTPNKEVYFYGRGKAILPEPIPNCMPCFRWVCERGDSCMNYITPKNVYENIEQLLKSNK